MSGFVIWLTGIAGGYLGFSRFKRLIKKRRYGLAMLGGYHLYRGFWPGISVGKPGFYGL